VSISVLVIVLFSAAGLLVPVKGSGSMNIFPPGSKPYGLSYEEHAENFWKWALKMPAEQNPANDPTGSKCANGQSNTNSSVFYLSFNSGGKSERACNVPAGKGLLIPVMQAEYSDKESPGFSVVDLNNAAKKDQDSVNSLYLKVDDREYLMKDLLKYRSHTEPFRVVFANNGLFGVTQGGPSTAVSDGFYILTEPLTKGNHTVHYKSSLLCPDPGCAEVAYAQDISYDIIAE
jgi:hypothetical protein